MIAEIASDRASPSALLPRMKEQEVIAIFRKVAGGNGCLEKVKLISNSLLPVPYGESTGSCYNKL